MQNVIIKLTNVSRIWNGRAALENVTLDVVRGETLVVTGPNGGGKTTLLRLMLKLLKPSEGSVTYLGPDGRPVSRLKCSYLPQKNHIDPKFPMTVADLVESGLLGTRGITAETRRLMVEEQISRMGLTDKSRASLGELSGGQLQRALIARAMISDPEILMLDEPLSYLDTANEERLRQMLAELCGVKTIVVVTHSLDIFRAMASRIIRVDHTVVSDEAT